MIRLAHKQGFLKSMIRLPPDPMIAIIHFSTVTETLANRLAEHYVWYNQLYRCAVRALKETTGDCVYVYLTF